MNLSQKILLTVRAIGPLGVAATAKAAGVRPGQAYAALYRLRQDNLVVRLKRARYDVTRRGRRVAAELLAPPPLLADGALFARCALFPDDPSKAIRRPLS